MEKTHQGTARKYARYGKVDAGACLLVQDVLQEFAKFGTDFSCADPKAIVACKSPNLLPQSKSVPLNVKS